MKIEGWRYYNHAAIPTTPPQNGVNLAPLSDGTIWKLDGKPLLARWVTDWDCGMETSWWECIREGPFSMDQLDATPRKHIRQALRKNTVVCCAITEQLAEQLYDIYAEAHEHYQNADNRVSKERFCSSLLKNRNSLEYYIACNTEGKPVAYMNVISHQGWASISSAKFNDEARKIGSSDALYYTVLDEYLNRRGMKYISSGERSINHETGTQEYKERVFRYRRAYSHLHIQYRWDVKFLISVFYPVRKLLRRHDSNVRLHQLNALLFMEELHREDKNKKT